MSSGAFTLAQYSTDADNIVPLRVQPETLAATLGSVNASASGSLSAGFPSAQVSKSKRGLGIHARTVSIRFDEGQTPEGYAVGAVLRIPVTTKARFDALSKASAVTYLTKTGKVVGKSPERIN